MKLGRYKYNRVNSRVHCPICDKADWCLIGAEGTYAICARSPEGSIRSVGDAGWLHRLSNAMPQVRLKRTSKTEGFYDKEKIQKVYNTLDFSIEALAPLALNLEVAIFTLHLLYVGYIDNAWYFPMKDGKNEIS